MNSLYKYIKMSEEIFVYAPPCCLSCGYPIGGDIQDYFNHIRKLRHMKVHDATTENIFELSDLTLMHSAENITMGDVLDKLKIFNTCCRSQLISWVPQMR